MLLHRVGYASAAGCTTRPSGTSSPAIPGPSASRWFPQRTWKLPFCTLSSRVRQCRGGGGNNRYRYTLIAMSFGGGRKLRQGWMMNGTSLDLLVKLENRIAVPPCRDRESRWPRGDCRDRRREGLLAAGVWSDRGAEEILFWADQNSRALRSTVGLGMGDCDTVGMNFKITLSISVRNEKNAIPARPYPIPTLGLVPRGLLLHGRVRGRVDALVRRGEGVRDLEGHWYGQVVLEECLVNSRKWKSQFVCFSFLVKWTVVV